MAEHRYNHSASWSSNSTEQFANRGTDVWGPRLNPPTSYNYPQAPTSNRQHVQSSFPSSTNTLHATVTNEARNMQSSHGPWQCPPLPHMGNQFAHNPNPFGSFLEGPQLSGNNPIDTSDWRPMPTWPPMRDVQGPVPTQPAGYNMSLPPVNANGSFHRGPYHAANNPPVPVSPYAGHPPFPGFGASGSERLRPMNMHNRRQSQHEHHRYSNHYFDVGDRLPGTFYGGPGRRSDRSISPRTSTARRNFERFSFDLGRAPTSSDADEAAARVPPAQRSRHRPREPRPRFFGQSQHFDPNIPTIRQLQNLKDTLKRLLPKELPEGSATECEICQKDYSKDWVTPTEEQEIVVELSCGHCFGEFCTIQWLDTCQKHKNKITCPKCRKLLLEPPRYHPALLNVLSRGGGPALEEILANELHGHFPQVAHG